FLLAAFLDQARIVLVVFLDPVQAGIVLALVLLHRGLLSIIVAGGGAAAASGAVVAVAAPGRTLGGACAPRPGAALLPSAPLSGGGWRVWFARCASRAAPRRAARAAVWRAMPLPRLAPSAQGPRCPVRRARNPCTRGRISAAVPVGCA